MRKASPFLGVLTLSLTLLACASTAPAALPASTAYVRAEAAPDPAPPPRVVLAPPASTLPGQLKRVPPPRILAPPSAEGSALGKAAPKAQQTVQDANHDSQQRPERDSFFNAIVQYAFEPGSLFQVYAAPMRVTDIALEPGEKIVGQPASGDVVRWVLALGKSMQSGVEQQHVYLKPTRADLETNLAINTDRRSYMLELHSYPDTYMAAVQWHYPQEEIARLTTEANDAAIQQQSSAPIVSLDTLNFGYTIQVINGAPRWTPIQVFDDGRRTFVRFPQAMLVREAPALFVLRAKDVQLVNYRVRGDTYVVDRLLDSAELRVGQQDQEIVRISRSTTPPPPPPRTADTAFINGYRR
jgi:P-type conjugative transfer protein TrbG